MCFIRFFMILYHTFYVGKFLELIFKNTKKKYTESKFICKLFYTSNRNLKLFTQNIPLNIFMKCVQ